MTKAVNSSERTTPFDIVFVGGGLANGLAAHRLATLRPELSLMMIEAGDSLGGNHTWSLHDGDLDVGERRWLEPFIVHRWPSYDVRFPRRARTLGTGYASVTSERFAEVVTHSLSGAVRLGERAAHIDVTRVRLASGETVRARCVVDGRGPAPSPHLTLGFQKFLGQEVKLAAPHGLEHPIVMDATVAQADGYRFVYVLPLSPDRLLVEDTYYADGPALDAASLRGRISDYIAASGWTVEHVMREEEGVLPIALGGDIESFWKAKAGIPSTGLAAALFHPTTGYSLPDAVRLADRLASLPDLSPQAVFAATREHSVATWRARGFFRLLNRLLFLAGEPSRRFEILQHFYRLPDPLVARFYAGRLAASDHLRILSGKPPVPVLSALRVLAAPSHISEGHA